ncbi:N-acetylmuramoyl-L-alanine amidase family protein [Listeria monocytogenes]|uniref:peptidoglycan recognition protein family protein n=1 Tax=Listeria monocytogenes TaxID=1639 RepID=UPI000D0B0051|nr:N-acetylmuramoyl-L-alanine amidase family protein [Listeria monocytogenes]EAC3199805.1 N-acetylmuramoyl-L-alanine amidase family protein [Listeria monocytogenes]EAC7678925.1 N-acetylmuramoyl-L-alanine amidase family protein [Listeria monocytogenes]EAF7984705.1 N-acetylmuramoyl-L-alanine amidase family protein [Listeria monocytogenes]EAG7636510.1 N-acetylmuramoyl-L-alanine amidase family protein [Listeria monocytogenes]ECK3766669.1 N-acetylmuramoyl-L-alanine amidase family protein [Listeria 
MTTVNGVPFRQNLVSSSKYNIKAPNAMKAKKITIHNTYNDASSQNETDYCKNNNNEVSFHVAVDDKEAIQVVPFNRNAWHCGDGGNGYGNRNTIGVETCYSKSGGAKYIAAEKNTIKYVAGLCVQQDIIASKDTIKKHQDWSGKYCPHRILAEKRWPAVQQAIIDEYNRITSKNPNRHDGKIVDSAPLLPKMDFKSNPARMYKSGTEFLVYEHNQYWYKTYIDDKLYYMYKSFCDVVAKKDAKGRIKVRIKSAKDLRIPVWNNTKLNSGKIKWYAPGVKLAWYDNKKGYLELWYEKDGWYYTANYFLK